MMSVLHIKFYSHYDTPFGVLIWIFMFYHHLNVHISCIWNHQIKMKLGQMCTNAKEHSKMKIKWYHSLPVWLERDPWNLDEAKQQLFIGYNKWDTFWPITFFNGWKYLSCNKMLVCARCTPIIEERSALFFNNKRNYHCNEHSCGTWHVGPLQHVKNKFICDQATCM